MQVALNTKTENLKTVSIWDTSLGRDTEDKQPNYF